MIDERADEYTQTNTEQYTGDRTTRGQTKNEHKSDEGRPRPE